MKVDIQKQDQHTVGISIEIETDRATAEYNKVCRKLSQRLNIHGFRRGKAPRQVIEKTVGVDKIKHEVLDRLLPHVFADAISEHQLDVVAAPVVESYSYEVGKPIEVKAVVEIRPEITLPEVTEIPVKVERYLTPEGTIDFELNNLVKRLITMESIIDRPAEKSDIVNINFAGAVNGELIRGGSANHYQLDLNENNFIEGFADQIVGHSIGEEFTINVKFPEEYHDQALKGKPAVFTIKINEIKKKVVPELNDETAKQLGPYENLQQLKDDLNSFIKQREDEENQFRAQKIVVEAFVNQAKLELTEKMIHREAQVLMSDMEKRFRAQGVNWQQYTEQEGMDNVWDTFKKEGEQRLKTSLVFSEYARQKDIKVEEAEYQQEVRHLAQLRNADEKAIFRELANNPGAVQSVLDHLVSQKVVDALMAMAKIELVDPAPHVHDENCSHNHHHETASVVTQENLEPASAE